MFNKLIVLTILIVCLGAGMLMLRHKRLQLVSRSTKQFQRIDQLKQDIWRAQSRAAELTQPHNLRQRLTEAQIALDPLPIPNTPQPTALTQRDTPTLAPIR